MEENQDKSTLTIPAIAPPTALPPTIKAGELLEKACRNIVRNYKLDLFLSVKISAQKRMDLAHQKMK
jgi:hypothetical protein